MRIVPAKTPNNMDVKIGEIYAIVQHLTIWGKSSRAKYYVVVAALTCCFFLFVLCRYAHYKNNTANFLEYSLECNTT